MRDIKKIYGELVFTEKQMIKYLGNSTYKRFQSAIADGSKEILNLELADKIANGMKRWALDMGATHYTHWFQPMNGMSAEKHESFIDPQKGGTIELKFSGKELIKGETDGSSFPSGGLRSTFEARGYTAWDASSRAFVRNETLYIPTIFMSYHGQVLDRKTALHRSSTAVKRQTIRFLKLFNINAKKARVTVGAEQEYFLIPKEMFNKRLDLKLTGRTLFGARSPKSQELEDHYYGQIKTRVMKFMIDLDTELWRLGIPSKTRHNEVAPCQHELAPIFERVSVAVDHNQLTMEIMKKTAEKHDLVCLLHEKPFAHMNGSGKHNNWSISADAVGNMLDPGDTPETNWRFLLFVTCIMSAVDKYQDLLRLSVATAGNEHRLGGNEAPPAIITMFLGEEISGILKNMSLGKQHNKKINRMTNISMKFITDFNSDTSDRNRTSPFAFTGNKFEFRMPGSSINLACVNTILNTALADELKLATNELEKNSSTEAIKKKIVQLYNAHERILFNGNGYEKSWEKQATARGLLNLKATPDAINRYDEPKNLTLFANHGIYTKEEILARKNILLEEYCKTIKIESLTMLDILNREILPAVYKFEKSLAKLVGQKKTLKVNFETELDLLNKITELVQNVGHAKTGLLNNLIKVRSVDDWYTKAKSYNVNVIKSMQEIRQACDELERLCPKHVWPFPTYADILFYS
ncbi:MAG: glutamine synthetase III [Mycoplasmataceae bacterium]|nr:glutamine synthetase III [Mycoplasmataceae bacterium]